MSTLKDLVKEAPVHERRLEIRTYPLDNGQLVVEGWLKDNRLIRGYHWNGKPREPGAVHRICVRMLIGGWPVTILNAEAEMPRIPHELCPTTLDTVKKIIGLQIVSGYSEKVSHLIGGVRGCNHMTHLIVVMGTAALHGYWTHASREHRPLPRSLDEFTGLSSLINSCMLWGEDGPIMEEIRTVVAANAEAEESVAPSKPALDKKSD